ncbi:MAG: dicarboxylate/amino acid:cation symporter [Deltaproteobacteria bacterium]|nr:dicarboxylate/amino acid:cation symporter [Deltaproteobacteria bacterium]
MPETTEASPFEEKQPERSPRKKLPLHYAILIAMVLGAGLGLPLNYAKGAGSVDAATADALAHAAHELGGLWLRLLSMLVVPLIISSLITGVTGMGNLRMLGRLGWRTLAYYLGTSLLAIATGLFFVNLIHPGVGAELAVLEQVAHGHAAPDVAASGGSVVSVLWRQVMHMVPKNPLKAAAEGDMLPIIFFSLLFGGFLSAARHGEKKSPPGVQQIIELFAGLFDVMMRMTLWVVSLAPIGVFGFMFYAAAGSGLGAFRALGLYALTVAAGLLVHGFITLPLLLLLLARRSPFAHARAMLPALLTAFSTASSNGTLPLTMRCVEDRAGVSPKVSAFVLPLGATINMDGTALYEAVAVLFIAQAYGVDLSLGQQLIVALTALLASIGAAGIPHAGTVMMVVVLSAVGLPTTAVGLILAVDRLLDMARTAINVWSDSTAAAVVERYAEEPTPATAASS